MASTSDAMLNIHRCTKPSWVCILMDISSLKDKEVEKLWRKDLFIIQFENDEDVSTPADSATITLPDHSHRTTKVKLSSNAIAMINNLLTLSNMSTVRAQLYVSCNNGICKLYISNSFHSIFITETQFLSTVGEQNAKVPSLTIQPTATVLSKGSKTKASRYKAITDSVKVDRNKNLDDDKRSEISQWSSAVSVISSISPESSMSQVSTTVVGNKYVRPPKTISDNSVVSSFLNK